MKDEIKEILDKLKDKNNYISHSMILLSIKETKALLDYITNLEQENEKVKKLKERYQLQKEAYKTINKRAIEFISEKISSTKGVINDLSYHKEHNKHILELLQEDIEMYTKELNILTGGDEE